MSDQQSSNPPEEEKTQPRKRLQKLMAGSEQNEAVLKGSQPIQTQPPADEQKTQVEPPAPTPPPSQAATFTTPSTERAPDSDASAGPQDPPPDPDATQAATSAIPVNRSDPNDFTTVPYQTGPDIAQTRPMPPSGVSSSRPSMSQGQLPPRGDEPTIPPGGTPPGSRSPSSTPPPFGSPNDPLPQRVEEIDPFATRVTPAAYQDRTPQPPRGYYPPGFQQTGTTRPSQQQQPPPYQQARPIYPQPAYPARRPVPPRTSGWKRSLGCMLRGIVALLFIAVFIFVAAGSWVIFQYFTIASALPPVEELRTRASKFETTRIFDRNGDVLYEIIDPNAGRRTQVPLSKISPYVIAATIATEDAGFYNHPGFDPVAIARAFYQNYTSGEITSGASTITQQIARALLLPQEQYERTYERKAREIVLASEITRRYSKDEILALYLNEINYGNLSYGIEAAAETYFQTSADKLTLGQAAFLAGLPQSPAVYDIYTNPEETLDRQKTVVRLMYDLSRDQNCIYVSNSPEKVCVDATAAVKAIEEIDNYNFEMKDNNMRYPHWVTFIRAILEAQYDPQTIYRSGFNVYTTLDPEMQEQAQQIITDQVASLADRNAKNGALVAIQPATGEILAMVGSPNFNDEASAGQINMAVMPRQPGSSIKPFTYLAAFEKGWTPATIIWDVPSEFPPSGDPNDPRPPYVPVNYDGRFHGPVTLRASLANSYNIPAVKALQFVGVYDNPDIPGEDGLIAYMRRLGITSLDRNDYGLALTLGGGEVSLLDMTSAYATVANGGRRMPPVAIIRIEDFAGTVVYEYHRPGGEQVIRPEHAFLMSSILSDNEARTPMFGPNSVINLPFQVAAKTGTTNDFRDNLTLGYTPDLAVGVWVGNADYTEMQNITGLTGAAPAWATFMQYAVPKLTNNNPSPFQKPANVVERVVCTISGHEPSEFCNSQRSEFFAVDQPPASKDDDFWKKVAVDTWTGMRASAECSGYSKDQLVLNVSDPWAVNWIKDTDQGRAWASSVGFEWPITFVPPRECRTSDPRPEIHFAGIGDGQTITQNPLDVYAVVKASAQFRQFRLEWGQGEDPAEWHMLVENVPNQYNNPERIHSWDLTDVPAGTITLRIFMDSTDTDRYAEKRIRLNLQVPTPTPSPTPTETPTPTSTTTPLPTETPTITPTPSVTPTPTDTPVTT